MFDRDLEHPDITSALATGYPRGGGEVELYCCECGNPIDEGKDIYFDEHNDMLCERCLLMLHRKED